MFSNAEYPVAVTFVGSSRLNLYTRAAGYCLVSTAQRDGVRLLAVVMGCDGALNAQIEDYYNFIDSRALYDWGFGNFSYRTLLSANEVVERQEVELAEGDTAAMLRPAEELRALMPNEVTDDDIRREVTLYNETLRAPIAAGTVLGDVKIYVGNTLYGTSKLVNSSAIELSRNAYLARRVAEILSKGWVITLLIVLSAFVLIYIILITRYRRLRRKHLRERRRAEKRRREEELQRRKQGVPFRSADPMDRYDFTAEMSEFFDNKEE